MASIEPMHRNKPNITYLLTYIIYGCARAMWVIYQYPLWFAVLHSNNLVTQYKVLKTPLPAQSPVEYLHPNGIH